MDSASPHVSERVVRALGKNRIMNIVFPAHATHLFHGLDLVLFGTLKTIKKTTDGDFGDDSVWDQITKSVGLSKSHDYSKTSDRRRFGSF
jgi:hypothetical protein